jgi:TRAP transporter 4TM/12TM fusion protein
MRSAGFKKEMAAGVEAAASSGGALVPPVMGAGAYMMLEIIDPPVTYLEILRAALIPAILYYLSLFLIVHFLSRKIGLAEPSSDEKGVEEKALRFEGAIFLVGIVGLVIFLLLGYSVFLAATISIVLVLVVSSLNARTRLAPRTALESLARSAKDMVPLIAAAACVGIVIGVVTLTGVGTKLPTRILDLAQGNLVSALILIMISSIVLGMGLPSSVCYLLMATLIGPVLSQLGVVPLAAHLFIFYFGMMSMVTPPVALAAYTAGSMAGASIMKTGFAAFRLALVGFTLPYMFVYRPQLLMLGPDGEAAAAGGVLAATTLAVLGIVPFAAAIAGYLFNPLSMPMRAVLFLSSLLLLFPTRIAGTAWILDTLGTALLLLVAFVNHRKN